MTKIIGILFTIFCISLTTNAQIKKDAILLGGHVFYNTSKTHDSALTRNQKNRNASFNISIGKAFKENSIYGINVTYSPSKNDYFYNPLITYKVNSYHLGVFYRQYKKLAKDFYFFTELGAAYFTSKQTNTDSSGIKLSTYNQSGGLSYLTPGISYKILKKLNLEILIPNIVSIGYSVTKSKAPTQNYRQEQFSFNTSINNSSPLGNLGVGFRFIL